MFMDDEKNERYLRVKEAQANAATATVKHAIAQSKTKAGWIAIGAIVALPTAIIPTAIILWRTALGI